jgi:hypothetical protein
MTLFGRWDRDVRQAMKGVPNFRVYVSRASVAASLWDFGEDGLAERALAMSDEDLQAIHRICAVYEDPSYQLPREGRIAHMHVNAFAAIAYFEGSLRPLARTRRRPEKDRPERFQHLPPDPLTGL